MRHLATILLSCFLCQFLAQGRDITILDKGWEIKPISNNAPNAPRKEVSVPHTWNAHFLEGTVEYNRETMVYRRNLSISAVGGKRHFLYFEGVNSVCEVFVNHLLAGEHKGGYTAFCIEITDLVKQGENELELWVSNSYRSDVVPLLGDFVIYGGIHRPCKLITTGQECISPLFYASPGIFAEQKTVNKEYADLNIKTLVSSHNYEGLMVRTTIEDPTGKVIKVDEVPASPVTEIPLHLENPSLWQGKAAPNLYRISSELVRSGNAIDKVEISTGLRSIEADPEKGILLNGEKYPVYGFGRHEDVADKGSALQMSDYLKDMDLVLESGATALRLTHYPHGEPIYDLADKYGILLWTEIPLCGPGGGVFAGFINSDSFKHNTIETLKELVYQKFNHPSICFWGLFNELIYDDGGGRFKDYGKPFVFIAELNRLYKSLDPSRLTTYALCEDGAPFLGTADLVAWNKYFGWYNPNMAAAGKFFDDVKASSGAYPVGISEYGAGASIYHHCQPKDFPEKTAAKFHPEERQSQVHEKMWELIKARPWFWCSFIWNLADFQSAMRNEGDTPGINDKGLTTYDRSVKKDAFFFYKAEWNKEPVLYISSRRFTKRSEAETEVKVYTNQSDATLFVNGIKIGTAKNDGMSRIVWPDVTLKKGDNLIEVTSGKGKKALRDYCIWTLN